MVSLKPNCPHFEISRTHKLRSHNSVATDFNPRSKLISFIQHYNYFERPFPLQFKSCLIRMLHLTQYVLNLKAAKSCLVYKNGVYKNHLLFFFPLTTTKSLRRQLKIGFPNMAYCSLLCVFMY